MSSYLFCRIHLYNGGSHASDITMAQRESSDMFSLCYRSYKLYECGITSFVKLKKIKDNFGSRLVGRLAKFENPKRVD